MEIATRIAAPVVVASAIAGLGCHRSATSPAPQGSAAASASADQDDPPEPGQEGDEPALPATTRPTGNGTPAALLAEADRELANMKESSYAHKTSIDEATGSYNYDCSGFVGYALEGAAPAAFAEIRAAEVSRPLAKHFESFFAGLPAGDPGGHWKSVAKARDLLPGDIVAWLKPADVTTKNSGHVMIVHGTVTPYEGSTTELLVPIVDATHVHHGKGDSRVPTDTYGLGTGAMVLILDAAGAPIGYRWSAAAGVRQHSCAVAMGRLVGP